MEEGTPEDKAKKKTVAQSVWELVRFALLVIVIVLPIRMFIVEPFVVSGSSMHPTFENADYLIVDKLSFRFGELKRGEIIIFRYPKNPETLFIKRVIGLPNETVNIEGSTVTITNENNRQGFTIKEPYVKKTANNNTHITLKSDEYFVMGDNRSGSSDSRIWGPVNQKFIVGKVLVRLLPINKINILPGYYKQTEVK